METGGGIFLSSDDEFDRFKIMIKRSARCASVVLSGRIIIGLPVR